MGIKVYLAGNTGLGCFEGSVGRFEVLFQQVPDLVFFAVLCLGGWKHAPITQVSGYQRPIHKCLTPEWHMKGRGLGSVNVHFYFTM